MASERRACRVLVVPVGFETDGATRGGPSPIARALRDAGDEVIATGSDQSAPMIVGAAIDEDVDCVVLDSVGPCDEEELAAVRDGLAAAGLTTAVVGIERGVGPVADQVGSVVAAIGFRAG